jgi:hypothetical protein
MLCRTLLMSGVGGALLAALLSTRMLAAMHNVLAAGYGASGSKEGPQQGSCSVQHLSHPSIAAYSTAAGSALSQGGVQPL